jgi:formate dehydrogenase accessory protein FdhE
VKIPSAPNAVPAAFERRAARADLLAGEHAAAAAPLFFAAGLYRAQAAAAAAVSRANGRQRLSGVLEADAAGFSEALRGIHCFAAASAPKELAEVARARAEEEPPLLVSRLGPLWMGDSNGREDYLARALLRPYVEVLASLQISPDRPARAGSCPFCSGPAWIAARRTAPDADGAQRYLGCALCGGEWIGNRLRCPVCSEEDPAKLPSFQSDRHPAVRVEACETCRHYLKSLDLTVDARVIPEVDDLVSVSIDLWAAEQGYMRIEPGLAGV